MQRSIASHRKFIFVKNVIINTIKIRYQLSMNETPLIKALFWILGRVKIIRITKMSFFAKYVAAQCACLVKSMGTMLKGLWQATN